MLRDGSEQKGFATDEEGGGRYVWVFLVLSIGLLYKKPYVGAIIFTCGVVG